ncbi:Short-chain dehydrogenase/reductase, conserved site [Sergentomyia squamirostris]
MAFEGKVVLITGASSGIGEETAVQFAAQGARVALIGRNQVGLTKTLNLCKKPTSEYSHLIIVADVTKEEDAKKIINSTIVHFGKLDILVNNAGIMDYGSIETTSLDQYDQVMNTNLRSVYQLTMLAVPHLIKTKGNIVNVSSCAGIRSFPNILAYCTSKAALDQLTRCVALELGSMQVRVNSVNPGIIMTDLHKRSGMDDKAVDSLMERCKHTHALGRAGRPSEVTAGILFLASDKAAFMTGAILPMGGGREIMCPR